MSVPRDERLSAGRVVSHLLVMVAVAAVLGVVVAGLAIPFAGVLGVGARNVAKAMDNLPAELETDPLPQRTRLLDSNGNTIATFYDENRVNVSLDQISRKMIKAIVSIEDSRFYEHGALDLKGTVRALVTNQANSGVVQGGSSITQQMVKMTLQTQATTRRSGPPPPRTPTRASSSELRYAIAFEQHHSKDWILERYLNIAYFGDGTYGIQSAARHYFDVNAKKLNLRQSAMLAGLVKNPTGYDPTNSPDRALRAAQRRARPDGAAQRDHPRARPTQAKETKLGLHAGPRRERLRQLAGAVLLRLRLRTTCSRTRRSARPSGSASGPLKSGGLTIRTTIDLARPGGRRRVGGRARLPDRPGHRRAGDGRAGHRRRQGDRPVAADGRRRRSSARPTSTTWSRRSTATPTASRPARRSRSSCWPRRSSRACPLNTTINSPQQVDIPMSNYPDCDGNCQSTDVWSPNNSTGAGTDQHLHRHPAAR